MTVSRGGQKSYSMVTTTHRGVSVASSGNTIRIEMPGAIDFTQPTPQPDYGNVRRITVGINSITDITPGNWEQPHPYQMFSAEMGIARSAAGWLNMMPLKFVLPPVISWALGVAFIDDSITYGVFFASAPYHVAAIARPDWWTAHLFYLK